MSIDKTERILLAPERSRPWRSREFFTERRRRETLGHPVHLHLFHDRHRADSGGAEVIFPSDMKPTLQRVCDFCGQVIRLDQQTVLLDGKQMHNRVRVGLQRTTKGRGAKAGVGQPMTKTEQRYAKMFDCNTARILKVGQRFFLILGWRRHTKDDDAVYWEKRETGKPPVRIDFEYLEEKAVASGSTMKELRESARLYKRLLSAKWTPELLKELANR